MKRWLALSTVINVSLVLLLPGFEEKIPNDKLIRVDMDTIPNTKTDIIKTKRIKRKVADAFRETKSNKRKVKVREESKDKEEVLYEAVMIVDRKGDIESLNVKEVFNEILEESSEEETPKVSNQEERLSVTDNLDTVDMLNTSVVSSSEESINSINTESVNTDKSREDILS